MKFISIISLLMLIQFATGCSVYRSNSRSQFETRAQEIIDASSSSSARLSVTCFQINKDQLAQIFEYENPSELEIFYSEELQNYYSCPTSVANSQDQN